MKKYKQLNEQEIADVQKKFNMLKEYSFITKKGDMLLDEDDEDPNQMPPAEDIGTQPQPGEGEQQAPEMGQEAQPQAEPQINPMDIQQPEVPAQSPPIPVAPEAPVEDGEIEIDVTDLVDDQKQVTDTVNSLVSQNGEMLELLSTLTNKVDNILSTTDTELQNIKAEIEKRNPTPTEVLQKHQTLGAPFTQTPEDYWNQKEAEGGYKLSDEPQEKEYELKASDLNGNDRDIYKSFGLGDDEINQSMKSVMGF